MASLTQDSMGMNLRKLGEIVLDREAWQPAVLQFMGLQRIGHNLVTEQQQQNLNHFAVHQKLT